MEEPGHGASINTEGGEQDFKWESGHGASMNTGGAEKVLKSHETRATVGHCYELIGDGSRNYVAVGSGTDKCIDEGRCCDVSCCGAGDGTIGVENIGDGVSRLYE